MPRKKTAPTLDTSTEGPRKGGFRWNAMSSLVSQQPAEAAEQIRLLLQQNNGNISHAARDADTTYKTMNRWLIRLKELGFDPRATTPESVSTSP